MNISFGLDNIGITGYMKNEIETNSFGIKANFSEFKIGFEGSTIIEESGKYMTKYQNASLSGWPIIAAVAFVQTGQWYSSSALLQAGS